MDAFNNIFSSLYNLGIIEYIIPFLLVFSLIYTILMNSKILGEDATAKKINVAVSIVFGFTAIIPHYLIKTGIDPGVPDLVEIISKAFPQVSLILLVILSIMILLGFMGMKFKPLHETNSGTYIALFLIALVVIIYLFSANILTKETPIIGKLFSSGNKELWNAVTGLAVFGIIVWLITKDDKEKENKKSLGDVVKELFQ